MRCLRPLLLFLVTCVSHAQAVQTWELDAARSHATFEVKILYLIGLHGEFGSVHGTLRVDRASGLATVDATIDTNAVHMRSRRYENWTKSAEFFDAQHFPQIHFASSSFALARLAEGGRIEGTLTIRGMRRPAAFDIAPPECDAPLRGACAVAASGTIRRSEFGMHSRRATLSDKVDLSLTIFVRPPPP